MLDIGPFQSHRVIVDGRRVLFLKATRERGKISLLLDGRYCLDVSVADADAFIRWIADAIAMGCTYQACARIEAPRACKRSATDSRQLVDLHCADHIRDWRSHMMPCSGRQSCLGRS
jgi:hypothetical protein